MADPYDPNDEEIFKKEYDDYQLSAVDKRSINEIRKKIKEKGYQDLDQIKRHLEFLENKCNELRMILQSEKKVGGVNWELERQIEEIKALYFDLEKIRKETIKK